MFNSIITIPSFVEVQTSDGWIKTVNSNDCFTTDACEISFKTSEKGLDIILEETKKPVSRIRVRWDGDFSSIQRVLGDSPGVAGGDLCWMPVVPEKHWAWYIQCFDGENTHGYGVKTGCNSFCFWQIDRRGISLVLDVRNGGCGVCLKQPLVCATVVQREGCDGENPFKSCQQFCKMMCDKPNIPHRPVFGLNNWYYAYGNISRDSVLTDANIAAELCPHTKNKPYMLIDDGWQLLHTDDYIGGPFVSSAKFGDMRELAYQIDKIGCEPGLWIRPLLTKEKFHDSMYHPRKLGSGGGLFLDPSNDGVLEYVSNMVSRISKDGYKIIKHDFTAPDMLTADIYDEIYLSEKITDDGWHFADTGLTNAQIIKNLYTTIQKAAGESLIMGCNTYNHLAAGIHEIQRSGLDTSGKSWNQTRKMGINPLAFRMPQNKNFFIADPDCAAITKDVPAEMNIRFFEACALSGESLFISITPGMLDEQQKRRISDSFALADNGSSAEPLDWFNTTCPSQFMSNNKIYEFDWYGLTNGVNVFE